MKLQDKEYSLILAGLAGKALLGAGSAALVGSALSQDRSRIQNRHLLDKMNHYKSLKKQGLATKKDELIYLKLKNEYDARIGRASRSGLLTPVAAELSKTDSEKQDHHEQRDLKYKAKVKAKEAAIQRYEDSRNAGRDKLTSIIRYHQEKRRHMQDHRDHIAKKDFSQ